MGRETVRAQDADGRLSWFALEFEEKEMKAENWDPRGRY